MTRTSLALLMPALQVLMWPAAAAEPGPPSDAVRPFYERPGLELQPSERSRFIDPARKVLAMDEKIRKEGEDGCLDPALPFDDTDYDYAEVMRTLKLDSAIDGEQAVVSATFRAAGDVARIEWRLRKIGAQWKIFDIVSLTKDWALSQFNCE